VIPVILNLFQDHLDFERDAEITAGWRDPDEAGQVQHDKLNYDK